MHTYIYCPPPALLPSSCKHSRTRTRTLTLRIMGTQWMLTTLWSSAQTTQKMMNAGSQHCKRQRKYLQSFTASMDSVTDPIWSILSRTALQDRNVWRYGVQFAEQGIASFDAHDVFLIHGGILLFHQWFLQIQWFWVASDISQWQPYRRLRQRRSSRVARISKLWCPEISWSNTSLGGNHCYNHGMILKRRGRTSPRVYQWQITGFAHHGLQFIHDVHTALFGPFRSWTNDDLRPTSLGKFGSSVTLWNQFLILWFMAKLILPRNQ